MSRSRIALVTLIACVASLGTGITASASADDIVGAGSTLVAPLMAQWTADYKSKTGVNVTYGAVGSGAGIAQITSRSVDFGASDAPLTPAQQSACNGCVQIPWGLTATVISYSLPGIPHLKLTGKVIAEIYLGHITTWNSKSIAKLNPGVKLPATKITPVFRSDGSGDTYAFTDYLSHVSSSWLHRIGTSTSVGFPVGVGGKGNDGVTALVKSTNGSIGYISASYVIAHKMAVAALQNAAGKFTYPNLSNIAAAAKSVTKAQPRNEMHIVNPPKKYKTAYPLSTFTYAIVPLSSPKAKDLSGFISYAMTTGQQFGAALDFAPIPKVVLNAGKATLAKLGG